MPVISRPPLFYNRVLPLIWLGACVALAVLALVTWGDRQEPAMWMFWLALGLLLAVFFLIPGRRNFADAVQDAGDALIVRKSGEQARIALTDIAGIDTRRYPIPLGAFYTVLTLSTPCCFGRQVRFLPVDERKFFSWDVGLVLQPAIIKDLIERINQARRKL